MTELKNNPHYINGLYLGSQIIRHIEHTVYQTIDNAIFRKEELVQDFRENLDYDETNKEVAENLGIIQTLKDEKARLLAEKGEGKVIDLHTIDEVATELGISISMEQAEEILEKYPEHQLMDKAGTWRLMLEHMIQEI